MVRWRNISPDDIERALNMSRKQLALFEPTLVVQALKEAVKN
ncbi:hypothetical protein SS322685_1165 [Shigella sonnei 3226-85]|nr:hypothetical protein SS322685_1165 [Shigella sonnei 3226-85]